MNLLGHDCVRQLKKDGDADLGAKNNHCFSFSLAEFSFYVLQRSCY